MERKASRKVKKNPGFKARLMNLLFFAARNSSVRREHDYEGERRQNERRISKSPKGVRTTEISLDGIHAERTVKDKKSRYTVFYIHGGGFTTGSVRQRRDLCQFMAGRYGCECIANDYRLSPENKWPAHLEDCHKVSLELRLLAVPAGDGNGWKLQSSETCLPGRNRRGIEGLPL